MKADKIKINFKELNEFKKKNAEERLRFIDFWAEYVKTHKDNNWSEQQAIIINNQIKKNI